jgi:hypothetical protein
MFYELQAKGKRKREGVNMEIWGREETILPRKIKPCPG